MTKESSLENFQWQAARAVIIALALRYSLTLNNTNLENVVPLIELGPRDFFIGLLNLVLLGFGFSLLVVSVKPVHYLFLSIATVFTWLVNYSATGAFHLHAGLLCIFAYVAERSDENDRPRVAAFFMSSTFLAAASFKLNHVYLDGHEFLPGGDFFAALHQFPALSDFLKSSGVLQVLAPISIVIEISLALLALVSFRWATHLALIFILAMALTHYWVMTVYYYFLPFMFLADKSLMLKLARLPQSQFLKSPFFWFFGVTAMSGTVFKVYPLDRMVLFIALMTAHGYWLFHELRSSSFRFDVSAKAVRAGWLVMPTLVLVTVAMKWAGAPGPMGYSMFAGIRHSANGHEVRYGDFEVCRLMSSVRSTTGNDTIFLWPDGSRSCRFKFPTSAGIIFVKEKVCAQVPSVRWEYKDRDTHTWVSEDCSVLKKNGEGEAK